MDNTSLDDSVKVLEVMVKKLWGRKLLNEEEINSLDFSSEDLDALTNVYLALTQRWEPTGRALE